MSPRFSDSLLPPGHELERLTRRARRARFDSSVRSRSVPNIHDATGSDDGTRPSPVINAQDYENSNAVVPLQIDDPDTTVPSIDNSHDAARPQKATLNDGRSSMKFKVATERDEMTLSMQRSHSRQDSDQYSETETIVPRRNLTVLDVASLIFNKMVGTGIFTTPGAVLGYTRSKPVSLALWLVGGVFTLLFILVYLEFGSALPFNGGELIYLDEVYPAPELLSTILFSAFFLCLGNSYGNSVTFSKQTLLASDSSATKMAELDTRLVRFIAISVLSVVCLLHYFSNRFGLFLNKLFAIFKTVLLLTVFIAGVKASSKEGSGLSDFGKTHGDRGATDGLSALVLIFYAYQGWENANYVAGEIRAPTKTLRRGAFMAIGLVTLLYLLVTVAYFVACDYETITDSDTDLGIAILFAPRAFGSSMGLKVCIALSAFGNLLAVTFTSSKVKQAIAVQRIIPFYKFFQKDINTPKGALVLHWLSSTLLIICCPVSADGYTFAVGLFTYGHIIVGTLVTLGLYRLTSRMQQTWPGWRPMIFTNKFVLYILPLVFTAGNLIILIWGAKPRSPGEIPRFWWPVIFFLIISGGAIYWACMVATQIRINHRGKDTTIGEVIGFQVKIYNESDEVVPPNMEEAIVQSRLDGSRRRVGYQFSGWFAKAGKGYSRTVDFISKFLF
ncbi:hypothetical protein RBB50_000330 [Rhinocladiella similis]